MSNQAALLPCKGILLSSLRLEPFCLTERTKLILGSGLLILELVAAVGLFCWMDTQDNALASYGVTLEQEARQ